MYFYYHLVSLLGQASSYPDRALFLVQLISSLKFHHSNSVDLNTFSPGIYSQFIVSVPIILSTFNRDVHLEVSADGLDMVK